MSEILNKIKLRIRRCEAHEQATTVVFISDLKEIVMRLDELEVLQDAIADYSETYDCKFHGEEHVLIVKAIQESHNRRKNNE